MSDKIVEGDSFDVLKTLEADSVDLLCTDPPYGYSFMGKSWDKTLPDIGIFKECFRVLKPGAFAFVMSAPRSDVCARMMLLLEDSGFDIGFTPLYHTYASGFPKAQNVHKKLTKDQETRKHEVREMWEAIIHSSSPIGEDNDGSYLPKVLADLEQKEQCEISSSDTEGKEVQVPERQRQSFVERWTDLSEKKGELRKCKVCSLPLGLYLNGARRWICYGTQNRDGDVSWTLIDEDGMCTSYKSRPDGQSARKSNALCLKCGTQAVRTLDGAFGGFQPKPAVEVVIVAMKPLSEKTFVDQALKNGKGITWLDDCRVPTADSNAGWNGLANKVFEHSGNGTYQPQHNKTGDPTTSTGRFPANLLISDDVLNDGRVTKATASAANYESSNNDNATHITHNIKSGVHFGDSGSYSRYFSLDAWAQTLPFLIVPKAAKSEKDAGLDEFVISNKARENAALTGAENRSPHQKNSHPTVKPLKLMSYLITLGSRPGDIVLDPFAGSGSTGIAAKQLKRDYILIEREKEYCDIAEARLKAVQETLL